MTAYVALLRAVNVGGRKLIMTELKAVADRLGLDGARTYIASGNLLFRSDRPEPEIKQQLEVELGRLMGAEVPVMIRSAEELVAIVAANPFPEQPGNRTVVIFLDAPPAADSLRAATGVVDERMEVGTREFYVAYANGMADSKLRIPAASRGTGRNMNTVTKLAQLCREMS